MNISKIHDMTLIVGYLKGGCPILVGDLLVSVEDTQEKEFVLPTVGCVKSTVISNGKYQPSRLAQKIILVSPNLAIAWSGTRIYATAFIKELIANGSHEHPSMKLISDAYKNVDGEGNISIIGLYRNTEGLSLFDFDAYSVSAQDYGFDWFSAAGTGINALPSIITDAETKMTGATTMLVDGLGAALGFTSALLATELISPINLRMQFGAGYEVAHPLGKNELTKFGNLTYVFWVVRETEKDLWKMLPYPVLASNYSYHKDLLMIRSARYYSDPGTSSRLKLESDEVHVVPPIHRIFKSDELKGYRPSSFNSPWLCNIFFSQNVNGMNSIHTEFQPTSSRRPIIWHNEFEKNGSCKVEKEFVASVLLSIAKGYRNSDR